MKLPRFSEFLALAAINFLMFSAVAPAAHAQDLVASVALPDAPAPAVEPAAPVTTPVRMAPIGEQHRFWDRQNCILFIAATAANGADFAVTRANLASGGRELNPVVRLFGRSTAGLAVNFAGETLGVMSMSYLFHKTGHHKLERAVALVNIGSSAGAVGYDLAHR